MTGLGCNVHSCTHNSDNCCCLNTIHVQGRNACDCDETCCGSYNEATGSYAQNTGHTPKTSLSISCDASNCIYNDNKKCSAEHINISGVCANDASETVCASFSCR